MTAMSQERALFSLRMGVRSPDRSVGHVDMRHNAVHQADPGGTAPVVEAGCSLTSVHRCRCFGVTGQRCCERSTAEDFRCNACRDWC